MQDFCVGSYIDLTLKRLLYLYDVLKYLKRLVLLVVASLGIRYM